jgi:hypothetical protein
MSNFEMDDRPADAVQGYLPTEADMRGLGMPDVDTSDDDVFDDGDDESQDPAHRMPGSAIEFEHPEVPDEPHFGPTIGLGPDDLPPYTHDERGDH